jgi:hypothetical protein
MPRKKHLRNIKSAYVDPEKNNWSHKHDGSKKVLPGRLDRRLKESKVIRFSLFGILYNSSRS